MNKNIEKPKEQKIKSKKDYIYAVGRRKTAIARVRLIKKGNGEIIINQKPYDKYFSLTEFKEIVTKPLDLVGERSKLNVTVKVGGGGIRGQAESVSHGITRALVKIEPEWRKTLKPLGLLKRDPRKKERKKPGLKRARRAPQFSKR
ncbi:30S ribosomal protein S9 [Candidatus Parcubacteria bacterium]|nr:MAG: 30S ribosomal protein S9 [Candidatus Parcubacteria bacterium]